MISVDDAFAEVMAPYNLDALRDPGPLPNGFMTLTFPDQSHKTFKVWTTERDNRRHRGRRVIGLLIGPQNTSDYEVVGYVNRDGIAPVNSRWQSERVKDYCAILWQLNLDPAAIEGMFLLISKRCLVCGRELTDPESHNRGVGPTCWKKLHG